MFNVLFLLQGKGEVLPYWLCFNVLFLLQGKGEVLPYWLCFNVLFLLQGKGEVLTYWLCFNVLFLLQGEGEVLTYWLCFNVLFLLQGKGEVLTYWLCFNVLFFLQGKGEALTYWLCFNVLFFLQGKGEVLTYWLESEDKSVRMKRQSCAYIGMDPGDDVYCRRTSGSSGVVHMPSVPVVNPDNNHVPLHRQSSGAEPTFLELMRETDPVPCLRHGKGVRRVPSIGLRRVPSGTAATGLKRLSFDARSMTKDIAAANGFVQRQGETDKTESNGARNALPAIVVDKTPLHLPDDNPSPSAYSPPPYPETSPSIAPSSDCMSTSGVCIGTNGECRATPSEFIASDMLPQQRENGADGHEVAHETDRLLDSGISGDESTRRACAAGIASAALDCGHNCTSASDNHKDYQEYSFTPLTNLNTSSTEMSHIICE